VLKVLCLIGILSAATTLCLSAETDEWNSYGGDIGSQHCSRLRQIDSANVKDLKLRWVWKPSEMQLVSGREIKVGPFQATPIVVGNLLIFPTPLNRVVALNSETGAIVWTFDPRSYEKVPLITSMGFIHRGVAMWRGTSKEGPRIYFNSRQRLWALNLQDGTPIKTFGGGGSIDLARNLRRPGKPWFVNSTSPPIIIGGVLIVGHCVSDIGNYKTDTTGEVQAFDVLDGHTLWKFNTVLDDGSWSKGTAPWLNDGHTNVWGPLSGDESQNAVFVPVSAPGSDHYGGARIGDNQLSDSIISLDVRTGRRRWSFQTVKHDLWDYDLAAAPIVADLKSGRGSKPLVIQLTKTGFVFVFDRISGRPLWPISEIRTPSSDVPGESAARSQPTTTAIDPLCRQGFGSGDVIDLSSALKKAAILRISRYRTGKLFTPPSLQGTVSMPGIFGCVNWGGGAFWPERGMLIPELCTAMSPPLRGDRDEPFGDPENMG